MKKFAIGCGVFAVVLIALGVGLVAWFGSWIKDSIPDAERIARIHAELVEAYGTADAFVPPLDGVYAADRVATFVDVRERARPVVMQVAERFDEIHEHGLASESRGIRHFFGQVGATFDVIRDVAHQEAVTDSLLRDAGMGPGEYEHLQAILLHGWLDLDDRRARWTSGIESADSTRAEVQALSRFITDVDARAGELLRRHLRNLVDAVDGDASEDVEAHVDALRNGDQDFPFTDPVPPSLATAFESFADRLRATAPTTLGEWLAESPGVINAQENGNAPTKRFSVEF